MYPETWIRENYNVRIYCEIAIKNYVEAKKSLCEFKKIEYIDNIWDVEEKFNQAMLITIVFSSMAIESFINNYLATCLGDNEFYDNYDNLKTIAKINMASKFILGKGIEKQSELYYCLNELMKNRNKIVHSKSKRCHKLLYTQENVLEKQDSLKNLSLKDMEKDFKMAKNSIKAMVLLSKFFDKHDKNVKAKFHFFSPQIDNADYKIEVFKEFKIT